MREERKIKMEKKEDSIVAFADKCIELFKFVFELPRKERQRLTESLNPEAREFLVWVAEAMAEALAQAEQMKH